MAAGKIPPILFDTIHLHNKPNFIALSTRICRRLLITLICRVETTVENDFLFVADGDPEQTLTCMYFETSIAI